MVKTAVFDLYAAKSTLWVEDDLTRLALIEFWSDLDLWVVTAGGRAGVEFLVRGAPRGLAGKAVMGLIDRDFWSDNQDKWAHPDTRILRTPAHEFENLLLDFPVLSAVSGKESATDIEEEARQYAKKIKWWMVCKTALHEISFAVSAYFPKDPPLPDPGSPMSQEAAADYITGSDYWKEHKNALRRWEPRDAIERRIRELGAAYDADLVSGEWVRSCSGKEIFRHLRSVMPGLRARAEGPRRTSSQTSSEIDENLAILIAGKLRTPTFKVSSSAAKIFAELRTVLRSRAGLRS